MKLGIHPEKTKSEKREHEKDEKKTDDETLKRFLGLLGEKKSTPKVKRQVWSNDDVDLIKDSFGNVKVDQQQVESRKRGGKGIFVTRTHIKFDDDDNDDTTDAGASNKSETNTETDEIVQKENSSAAKETNEHESDNENNDFIEEDVDEEENKEDDGNKENNDNSKEGESDDETNEKDDEEEKKEKEKVDDESNHNPQERQINVDEWEEGRLFVRNLSFDVKEDELQQLFKRYGTLNEVHLPIDPKTGKGKGYAHIMYMIPQNALQAYNDLDGKPFQGRLLHILPGKRQPRNATGFIISFLSYSFSYNFIRLIIYFI